MEIGVQETSGQDNEFEGVFRCLHYESHAMCSDVPSDGSKGPVQTLLLGLSRYFGFIF